MRPLEYRNYLIEPFRDGYTVWYEGDEVYFDDTESAKEFIDSQARGAFEDLFNRLVPEKGKCSSKGGEIIRAVMRLYHRFYNDGDKLGIGYGNHTCNMAGRFLLFNSSTEIVEVVKKMWGNEDSAQYKEELNNLIYESVKLITRYPRIKDIPTIDMFEYKTQEDEEKSWD